MLHQIISAFSVILLVDPELPLTLCPKPLLCDSTGISVVSDAMLLTIYPLSIILTTIWPSVNPMAVFPVLDVFSFIRLSICRYLLSLTMLFSIQPTPVVLTTVRPSTLTLPLDGIALELPNVILSIWPCEGAFTGSRAVFVVAFEL